MFSVEVYFTTTLHFESVSIQMCLLETNYGKVELKHTFKV
jgi:hypothetical protein